MHTITHDTKLIDDETDVELCINVKMSYVQMLCGEGYHDLIFDHIQAAIAEASVKYNDILFKNSSKS